MNEIPSGTALAAPERALVGRFRAGDEAALARVITRVENRRPGFETLLEALREGVGRARRVGITGPPGAGKSTLINRLVREYLARGLRVAVIAVDPSSPLTGGALLGDRIRMDDLITLPDVFIRSMASRGAVGGLAMAAREVADLLDAFGFDRIVLETVGVGQTEMEIAGSADTTVVVLMPESGDGIQAMKAGLFEVADIFVVNKADRPGAERLLRELEVMKSLRTGRALWGIPAHHGVDLAALGPPDAPSEPDASVGPDAPSEPDPGKGWEVRVLMTVAERGEGVGELMDAIEAHFDRLETSGELAGRRRRAWLEHVRSVLIRSVESAATRHFERWRAALRELDDRAKGPAGMDSPYAVARRLSEEVRSGSSALPEA